MDIVCVTLLLILGSLAGCEALDFAFNCSEGASTPSLTPPVVNVPVYSYKVSISVQSRNETLEAYEVYDSPNGEINMYVNYPDPDNASIWISDWIKYDYNHSQTLTVNLDSKTCIVNDLEPNDTISSASIFGFGIENGFNNVNYSYHWTGNYTYTKGNDTVINGVLAEKYSTCLLFNNDTVKYDVDLYFSSEKWNSKGGANVPLMLVLKVNQTQDGDSFTTEEYTYLFTSYRHDTKTSWNGGLNSDLWDVVCPGRKDERTLPKAFRNFALMEEWYDTDHKMITTSRKVFNYDAKLARADFIGPKSMAYGGPPLQNHHYTLIQDFHAGVTYQIDRETSNCSVSALSMSKMLYDVLPDPSHPGKLMMVDFVQSTEDRNFTYTGRHQHRDFMVDTWTSTVPMKLNLSKGEFELNETVAFTTHDWSNSDISPVLIMKIHKVKRTFKNGTTKSHTIKVHVSGYTPTSHGYHTFDVGQCYNGGRVRSIVLKFDSAFGEFIDQYSTVMDVAIRNTVANASKVRTMRVGSWIRKEVAYDYEGQKNNQKSLFVTVFLYDHPMIHANTTEYEKSINLTEAANNLETAVKANELLVSFSLTDGTAKVMVAFPNYFKNQGDLYSPAPPSSPTPAPSPSPPAGLSKGAVAGVAIAMLVVGVLVGAIFSHYRNKRGNRQFGYSLQD